MAEISVPLMIAGLSVSAGSTAFSIYNNLGTASAQAEQARINGQYQKDESRRRAAILQKNASIEENEMRRKSKRNLASVEAQYGASGITMAGSPSELLAEQAMYDEYNIELQRANNQEKINSVITSGNNALILGESSAKSYEAAGISNSIGSGLSFAGTAAMSSASFFKEVDASDIGNNFNYLSGKFE